MSRNRRHSTPHGFSLLAWMGLSSCSLSLGFHKSGACRPADGLKAANAGIESLTAPDRAPLPDPTFEYPTDPWAATMAPRPARRAPGRHGDLQRLPAARAGLRQLLIWSGEGRWPRRYRELCRS